MLATWFTTLTDGASTLDNSWGIAWLLDMAARASVPFVLALILAWGLSQRAARLRHATWTMAVLGALLFPLLSWLEPRWHFAVWSSPDVGAAESVDEGVAASMPLVEGVAEPHLSRENDAVALEPHALEEGGEHGSDGHGEHGEHGEHEVAVGFEPEAALPVAGTMARGATFPWRTSLLGLWLAGFAVGLAYLFCGVRRSRRLAERAGTRVDFDTLAIAVRLSRELGLPRYVDVLVSDEVHSPMTFGWRRPVVLLPTEALTWKLERREVVLSHELVHVKRRDWLAQLVAQVARAFYWFHPLAWLAFRRMSIERERSCDEGVLALGAVPSVYARHLLDIAVGMQGRRVNGTVLAMAHRTQLEGRLMSILEDDRRGRRGQFWLAPVCLIMMGTSGALAAARTYAAPPQEHQEHEEHQERAEVTELAEPGAQATRTPVDVPHEASEAAESRMSDPTRKSRRAGSTPPVEFSYFTLQREGGKKPMKLSGRMWGIWDEEDPTLQPLWLNNERVRSIFEEARPYLEQLRPYEEQLEAIHEEMAPLHDRMDEIHESMEPLHELQDKVHEEMEPLHKEQDEVHQKMQPFHDKIDEIHEHMDTFHEEQDQHHEELDAFHRRQDAIHREMDSIHREQDKLHEALEPLRRELRSKEKERKKLQKQLSKLKPTHARYRELKLEIADVEVGIAQVQDELKQAHKKIDGVHDRLAPYHRRIEKLHKEMEPLHSMLEKIHEKLEPFHHEIGKLHEHMEPFHSHLEKIHERMEPFHRRLETFHEKMAPYHQRLEKIHEQMEPYHRRMEPIHEAMEPIREKLEPIWERMNDVLRDEVKGMWDDHLDRAEGLEDPALRQLLFEGRNELFKSVSWGWAVTREPATIRLHAGWRNSDGTLDRALKAYFVDRGIVLSESDQRALEGIRLPFTDTLYRVHYRL